MNIEKLVNFVPEEYHWIVQIFATIIVVAFMIQYLLKIFQSEQYRRAFFPVIRVLSLKTAELNSSPLESSEKYIKITSLVGFVFYYFVALCMGAFATLMGVFLLFELDLPIYWWGVAVCFFFMIISAGFSRLCKVAGDKDLVNYRNPNG